MEYFQREGKIPDIHVWLLSDLSYWKETVTKGIRINLEIVTFISITTVLIISACFRFYKILSCFRFVSRIYDLIIIHTSFRFFICICQNFAI